MKRISVQSAWKQCKDENTRLKSDGSTDSLSYTIMAYENSQIEKIQQVIQSSGRQYGCLATLWFLMCVYDYTEYHETDWWLPFAIFEGDSTAEEYEMLPGKNIYLCEVQHVESCLCLRNRHISCDGPHWMGVKLWLKSYSSILFTCLP